MASLTKFNSLYRQWICIWISHWMIKPENCTQVYFTRLANRFTSTRVPMYKTWKPKDRCMAQGMCKYDGKNKNMPTFVKAFQQS